MIKTQPLQFLLGVLLTGVLWALTQLGLWVYPEFGKLLDNIPGKVVLSVLLLLLLSLSSVSVVAFYLHNKLKKIESKEDPYHGLIFDQRYSLWKDKNDSFYCPYCLETKKLKSKISNSEFEREAYCQMCQKTYSSPSHRFRDYV